MNAAQEEEWQKAQEIGISADVDLITAAKQQLLFLGSVYRYRCLYDGPALQRAIYRYEQCWLPLLAEHTVWGNTKFQLVVPLDCEWIWHCHRLNPVQYGKDCKKIYGRILDASFVESSIKGADRKQTQEIWKYSYPEEPYELDLSHSIPGNFAGMIFKSILKIEYDLTEAVRRQSSFFHQVSRPCMFNDQFLKGAEERYKGFLYLIKKNRDNSVNCFCVPTYDIDLIWHSHQLQPVAYTRDMLNLLGKVVAHDDTESDRSKGEAVATAEELITVGGTAQWALMNYSWNLLIRNIDNFIKEEPLFELRGNLGSPLRLLSGKKLQYEVQCANPEVEHEFVTLVRYTPEAPFGQATALFNWKSGTVEVTAQESVLLVAFLSEVISASLRKHHKRLKYTSSLEAEAKKLFPTGSEGSHGPRVKGSDQKIKGGGNRRRSGYGNSRWVGRGGANGIAGTKSSRAELALLLMGIDDERYVRAGCEGGCGG